MSYALFQIQCRAIELTLALAEREYLRYPPGTIIDGVNVGGQFAMDKKSSQEIVKEPTIAPDSLMGRIVQSLEQRFKKDKGLEPKVERITAQISKDIVAMYPIDQTPLELSGKTFGRKLEEAATKYKTFEDKVISESVPAKKKDFLGEFMKSSIPLAVAVSLALGGEVAIGLFLGQHISEILVGSAIAFGVSVNVDKGLDSLHVENPIIRMITQLATGVAVGSVITKVTKDAAIEAKNITEVADKFLTQANESGLQGKIKDSYKIATVLKRDKIDSQKVLEALQREISRETPIEGKKLPERLKLHSFSERLNEYAELSTDPRTFTSKGREWRKGIIDAELKYGEQLHKIHEVSIRNAFLPDQLIAYENFLDSIRQGKKQGRSNIIGVDKATVDRFKNDPTWAIDKSKFVTSGTRTHEGFREPITTDIGQQIADVQKEAKEVQQLAGIDLGDIVIGYRETKTNTGIEPVRAYVLDISNTSKIRTFLHVALGGEAREVAFHEVGHIIEKVKRVAALSVDYIKSRRIRGEVEVIDNKKVVATDFISQYTGKTYKIPGVALPIDVGGTEVVSMGLEHLTSFYRLHRAVRDDIDHLRYTLFVLDKGTKK